MTDLVSAAAGRIERDSQTSYRPDIDGLRAIAVCAVVLFHAGIPHIPGGFVGVDVFFVISGFLVGSHVLRSVDTGYFSLVGFYERRARRILPALFAMLLVVAVAALAVLTPEETLEVAKSGVATLLFSSNFYFLHQSGYFAPDSALSPLLHTWSLGVEEQFYIVFPLPVWGLRKWMSASTAKLVIAGLAVISFAASIPGGLSRDPSCFYMLPTRAWELLIGTLLAEGLIPSPRRALTRNLAAGVGLALIAVAVLKFSSNTRFPGAAAAIPCLGAVLIIGAGQSAQGAISRALSLRPVVFLGLLSYSLYLWHWPVIVFLNRLTILGPALPAPERWAAIIAVSLALAFLSWRLVESPFRSRKLVTDRTVWRFSTVGIGSLICVFLTAIWFGGFPSRLAEPAREIASYLEYKPIASKAMEENRCFITSGSGSRQIDRAYCLSRKKDAPNILLVGDSHAADLRAGITAKNPGVNLMQATASGCRPTITRDRTDVARCGQLMSWLWKDFIPSSRVDRLILSARWYESDLAGLAKTLDQASVDRVPVTVVGPAPEYRLPLPLILTVASQAGLNGKDGQSAAQRLLDSSRRSLDEKVQAVAKAHGAAYASLIKAFCSPSECRAFSGGARPLQFDADHFTVEGSKIAASALDLKLPAGPGDGALSTTGLTLKGPE